MSRTAFRKMLRNNSRNKSGRKRLRSLASMLAGLSVPGLAAAQSVPYPTYVTGPQPDGSWVVSDGQIITPAGTQVNLGIRVRAKAIAVNPNVSTHTAAVLTMGTSTSDGNGAVEIFDTSTGAVLQNYITVGLDSDGSYSGITYSADGKYLVFSQDGESYSVVPGGSPAPFVTVAKVTAEGLLEDEVQISVPPNNSFITCFPNSPPASYGNPCGSLLYCEHILSRRRRVLKGWQKHLRAAEPEQYARQDRPDRDDAGARRADPRGQRAAQPPD
jgi:hypothetical protein